MYPVSCVLESRVQRRVPGTAVLEYQYLISSMGTVPRYSSTHVDLLRCVPGTYAGRGVHGRAPARAHRRSVTIVIVICPALTKFSTRVPGPAACNYYYLS
eukprot:SAG31_NODE_28792_length_405_cov_0.676471_1_plen_99_part_10